MVDASRTVKVLTCYFLPMLSFIPLALFGGASLLQLVNTQRNATVGESAEAVVLPEQNASDCKTVEKTRLSNS